MKAASVSEIKTELKSLSQSQVTDLCLRLARFKKENKELLTFLLFEADDLDTYIQNVKNETVESFADINKSNLYWAKKSLRKIFYSFVFKGTNLYDHILEVDYYFVKKINMSMLFLKVFISTFLFYTSS